MTPGAFQQASFEENRGPNARPVMNGVSLNVEDYTCILHVHWKTSVLSAKVSYERGKSAVGQSCPWSSLNKRGNCLIVNGKDQPKRLNRERFQELWTAGGVLLQRCCRMMPVTMKINPMIVEGNILSPTMR